MLIEATVWTSVGEFDFQNDLFIDKGLIMDLSLENHLLSANAGIERRLRVHLYLTVSQICPSSIFPNKKISEFNNLFCQTPRRREKAYVQSRQRNQEKLLRNLRMK